MENQGCGFTEPCPGAKTDKSTLTTFPPPSCRCAVVPSLWGRQPCAFVCTLAPFQWETELATSPDPARERFRRHWCWHHPVLQGTSLACFRLVLPLVTLYGEITIDAPFSKTAQNMEIWHGNHAVPAFPRPLFCFVEALECWLFPCLKTVIGEKVRVGLRASCAGVVKQRMFFLKQPLWANCFCRGRRVPCCLTNAICHPASCGATLPSLWKQHQCQT